MPDVQDQADQAVARRLVGEIDAMIAEIATLRAAYEQKLTAYRQATW